MEPTETKMSTAICCNDRKTLTIRLSGLVIVFLALFLTAGCRLCGCSESDADAATLLIAQAAAGGPVNSATLTQNTHVFGDNEFTLTIQIPNARPIVSKGTFSKSGDSVTFKVTNGVSALIFPGTYKLSCQEQDGKKVIVLQRQNPLGPALKFVCH